MHVIAEKFQVEKTQLVDVVLNKDKMYKSWINISQKDSKYSEVEKIWRNV